jgi:1-acyl-sn-glycerol-3-phosphate acyltransferase
MSHVQLAIIPAGLIVSLGIVFLSRRQTSALPLPIELLRKFAFVYLVFFKKFRVIGAEYIPHSGPMVLVANHTAVYDPVCLQVACRNRFIRFMEAREYFNQRPLTTIYRALRVIPVNRTGNDTVSIRTAVRELSNDGCIGIFPEGRISDDCQLQEGRKGVALLALMTNAVVAPAYIQGARPFSGMMRDFLQFNQVTLHFGPPIRFDDLVGRHRDRDARDIALKRIMDAIIALQVRSELCRSGPNPETLRNEKLVVSK